MTSQFILLFIGSFSVSLLLTPVVIAWAQKYAITDDPERQHPGIMHTAPIPRAGGIAMFIAFVVMSLAFIPHSPLLYAILIGSGLIVIAGVIDDVFEISPYIRLFAIWPIAILIVISQGLTFYMTNPYGQGLLYFDSLKIALPITVLPLLIIPAHLIIIVWIIWVINMVKLTKGASQLPGMAFFAFLTIAAVSLKYAYGSSEQINTAYLAMIMAGSVLAFVPFNFPPEKMFPGDSASAFIGFMLGVLSIISGGKLATAILVLSIPAVDMIAIIVTRLLQGKNPLTHPGKDHLYHKLIALGLDKRIVIFIYWLLTAVMGVISVYLGSIRQKLFVLVTIAVITLAVFVIAHYVLQKRIETQNN